MDWLSQRCPLPNAHTCPRPGWLVCLLLAIVSLLMYPVLRSIGLQVHSTLTGNYISGTHSVAFVNCPNEQIAKDIARYFWKGEIEEATEILLLVKTKTSKINELSNYIRSIHPFEIPEIISLPIDQGNALYLKWIEEGVTED
ncbi:protein CutA isoform X2 [Ornithorhynchus anatinus]|uniref:protein CutA isoform X2 n=1 Tax=Ornithorhynchus anatinus TaxID=9258 RepID=UPI0010A81B6A|nr:protein CutA isoform X2 [Ornithorhynchus anatinus]